MPVSESISILKTVVVTADAISPTNAAVPNIHDSHSILSDGTCHLNTTVFFFPIKCVRHTSILHIGEAAVAIAAPSSPSFIGNINI